MVTEGCLLSIRNDKPDLNACEMRNSLYPAPVRGGGRLDAPLMFFACLFCILSAYFLKISVQGHLMSRHQARSSDPTFENICDCAVTEVPKGSTWHFQELIRVSVPTTRLSRNFDINDLRSGPFSCHTIIRQWENVQMPFIPKVREGSC